METIRKMQGVLPMVCYTVRNKMHHVLLNNMSLPVEHEEKDWIFKNVTYSLRKVIIDGFVFLNHNMFKIAGWKPTICN